MKILNVRVLNIQRIPTRGPPWPQNQLFLLHAHSRIRPFRKKDNRPVLIYVITRTRFQRSNGKIFGLVNPRIDVRRSSLRATKPVLYRIFVAGLSLKKHRAWTVYNLTGKWGSLKFGINFEDTHFSSARPQFCPLSHSPTIFLVLDQVLN